MAGPIPRQPTEAQVNAYIEAIDQALPFTQESVTDFRARLDRATRGELEAIDPVISEPSDSGLSVGRFLFERVGHLNLSPYAWIYADGDERKETASLNGEYVELNMVRAGGLKSMTCTNEYGKYPTVEFEVYDPDFRKRRGTVNGEQPDKGLYEKFKIGKKFSVRFGYRSAFTAWNDLKVVESEVTFEEGTVVLRVKGRAAHRLLSTHSADVFTKEFGKSALDAIARVVDMKVDYKQILGEEYDRILSQARASSPSIAISAHIFKATAKADVDFFYDPEYQSLRLQTPYKMELIKRGSKPRQITYGYPSSPISSLSIETKYPKKKFAGKGQGLGNNQDPKDPNEEVKNRKIRALVSGYLYSAEGEPFAFGIPEVYTQDAAGQDKLAKKYPMVQGYEYERDEQTLSTSIAGISTAYYRIYRNFDINADELQEEEVVWTETEARIYGGAQGGSSIFVPTSVEPHPDTPTVLVVIGNKYSKRETAGKPATPVAPANPPATTTTKVEEKSGTQEYQYKATGETAGIATANLNASYAPGSEVYQQQKKIEALKKKARESNDQYRVKQVDNNGRTTFVLTERTEVSVTKPEAPAVEAAEQKGAPAETNTQAGDPVPDFTPASAGTSTVASGARRKGPVTTLTLQMKAGDYTLRIGDLIELTDMYKSMDGFYYIHSEEHKVSADGFHTEIKCRKALSKSVKEYAGARTPAPRSGGRSATSGESADANNARKQVTIVNIDKEREAESAKAAEARAKQEAAAAAERNQAFRVSGFKL
jgi:hypothetical protein